MGPFIKYQVRAPKQCYVLDLLCFTESVVNYVWVSLPVLWRQVLGLTCVDRLVRGHSADRLGAGICIQVV